MGFEFNTPPAGKHTFWLSQRSLVDRLTWLLPGFSPEWVSVHTTELSGNASFVNYVRLHQLTHKPSGTILRLVEKSIRKLAGISSLESRFLSESEMLGACRHFQHPCCYGVLETPTASLIFTEYVQGKAPRMHLIATQMAQGIAELENVTHSYLLQALRHRRWHYWQMDFFRPWYLLRPRFSFARCFRHLRALALEDARFRGLEEPLREFIVELRAQGRKVRRSPRCFCHLDYLRKNLFVSPKGLQLIDWSEVKVGRVGFDAGAYLSALFRRNDMARYVLARDEFLAAYLGALAPAFDATQALNNARYLFLLNSLWNCMRAEAIEEFKAADRLPLLKEKLEYLLSLRRPQAGTNCRSA